MHGCFCVHTQAGARNGQEIAQQSFLLVGDASETALQATPTQQLTAIHH